MTFKIVFFSRLNLWNELSSVKMVVMSSQNVVNRKFSFGSGPKRAVDRINKYFRDSTSISRALHNLLDKFDGDEQTDCEKKQARERLAKYRYFYRKTPCLSKPLWHKWFKLNSKSRIFTRRRLWNWQNNSARKTCGRFAINKRIFHALQSPPKRLWSISSTCCSCW